MKHYTLRKPSKQNHEQCERAEIQTELEEDELKEWLNYDVDIISSKEI